MWRDAGRLPDASLRILQRELDHEEHALPGLNRRITGSGKINFEQMAQDGY